MLTLILDCAANVGLTGFDGIDMDMLSCRMLWPTLQDTENKTVTEKSQKSAKVLQFPVRSSRKVEVAVASKLPKLALAA